MSFHAVATLAAAWGPPPSSRLQQRLYEGFGWYYGLIDQGYTYRFYSPDPPPTPVVTAVLRRRDGSEEEVRLPDRRTRPRLLYQRELGLANHLHEDVERARGETGDPSRSLLAQSYARHLGRVHPGVTSVTLSIRMSLIPDPRRIIGPGGSDQPTMPVYSTPERIGDFPCDAS